MLSNGRLSPGHTLCMGLPNLALIPAGLHRGLFHCGAGKEKPRSGSSTPRLCLSLKPPEGNKRIQFRCCYHLRTEYHESCRKSSPKTIKKSEVVNLRHKSPSVNFSPSAYRVRRAFYASPVLPPRPSWARWYRSPRGQQGRAPRGGARRSEPREARTPERAAGQHPRTQLYKIQSDFCMYPGLHTKV